MEKHTLGPWEVHPLAPLAVHQPEYECWIPQSKADAQLIAAAPDLLNALKVLADVAERKGIPCDAAHAAIAKATGEQK